MRICGSGDGGGGGGGGGTGSTGKGSDGGEIIPGGSLSLSPCDFVRRVRSAPIRTTSIISLWVMRRVFVM